MLKSKIVRRLALIGLLAASIFAASTIRSHADPWPPECQIWDICD